LERGKGELPDALDMPALLSGSQQWGGIDDRGYLFGYSNVGNEAVVWIGKEPLAVEDPRKLASVPGRLHRLAIGPRGRQVAAVIDDGLVRMLDVRTGKPLWTFAASADIVGPRWSADGSLFAIATLFGGGVVLDARTGDAILQRCGSRFERSTALRVEAFADAVCLCEG
jgi:outer membrane protein assembly factor BamB